ncbi:fatty acid synthase alpha-subunit [Saitoella complicata NRRL Y-17804]|uniref:Fatty acid synthase subunit alpha n=1 Tax=Saitoella complicata (strain BCRC 22490 / CBS 7301 / JCM 7358 / NBRC 10748 / NRRL Y-17804) TaxID=698492 RepID=A0A0E9N9V8_SAICN|nr:fatty acid synthase alpha-subunit [Saitoella complicata NRRL Y-17804]ODQ56452.1 fatty acid synthase alpha-subunit [Saitoella complicata NRRL Y-17804]GAO46578.1 hypothetical protein G7K_0807-t1 [Saitoella complicata NRRL Y-17804]
MRPETEQELAHTLLIELLAYQFASPVRWIETQDVLFSSNTERLVEIGPSPTLVGMANRTLKAKYEAYDAALSLNRQTLCYTKDQKEIYYNIESEEPAAAPAAAAPAAAAAPIPAAAASGPVAAAPAPAAAPAGPAVDIPDEPVKAVDVLHCLIAQKLKKTTDEIPVSKAIKDLVGGKSTLQNEILGDLQKEFGSTPEKPEDSPLDELGAAIQPSFSGALGKQSSGLIARLMSSKMPGGFSVASARTYLQTRWGLGSGRQDAILLLALTMEPAARLGGEPDAKAFLDTVAQKYAGKAGITLAAAAAGGAGGGAGGAVIDSAALEALQKDQNKLVEQQLELFARYLKQDLRAGEKAHLAEKEVSETLRAQLDLWNVEHGEFYAAGIEPVFTKEKARVYDSEWNWARQDALTMYYDIIFGKLKLVDREIVARCIAIMNRTNPTLLEFMQYHIDHCPADKGDTYQLAKDLGQQLIANCLEAADAAPVYKDVMYPTGPKTTIDAKGGMSYSEVARPAVRKLEDYVSEMAAGGKMTEYGNRAKVQADLSKIYKLIKTNGKMSKSSKLQMKALYGDVLRALAFNENKILGEGSPKPSAGRRQSSARRGTRPEFGSAAAAKASSKAKTETIPFLHLKRKEEHGWEFDQRLTSIYLNCLEQAAKNGVTFQHKNVLITGAGAGSIGAELLQGLISGGAKVVVTTSRYSREVTEFYQGLFARYGSKGSSLIVVPFNQGSKQDVDKLVEYIYDEKNGLGWDLDYIVPFAAIPENGREIDNIDSRSELAHRIMLTNLLRLLGGVKAQKLARGFDTRPAQVVLPMSPNHGTFGNDGLYSESKLALETLFNRWYSESWGGYLTVTGAVIGWTRGTGLMSANNSIAEGIESFGVRTFSQQEMAFNILGLMAPAIVNLCQNEPVWADLNGGLQFLPNLKDLSSKLRQQLQETAQIRQAVAAENAIEHKIVNGAEAERLHKKHIVQPRANLKFDFPTIKSAKELQHLAHMKGMVDLDRVVVVTGFSEVGPYGNSRTRWEYEAAGEFSLEGCIEMAWIMGYIKNHNGRLKNGNTYSGWVDAKSGEPVEDKDVKAKYEKLIIEHTGIRLIEPEIFQGYDPKKKQLMQEVVIDQDLEPFVTSKETAGEFKLQHGDKVEIYEIKESGEYQVIFKRGATLVIPKALRFDRLVAGQIPTGWDPKRYGIADDIISQVDPITLYVLVSTVEALVSAGIVDPYEFYKYVHVSEVGNTAGSGVGGMTALRGMYKDRFLDKPVQKDILQESFINTMSAWVNMLLLSSSGPIKTPVGACATAVESVDIGYDTIISGKAKVVVVGGYDDFQEEGSFEFANMGATSNAEQEFKHGRTPKEMSRPTTTTRNGFMEAHGAGIEILMSAKLAIEMGVPIYGIIGGVWTATDKEGRSVPAPGQGILAATTKEVPSKFPSPLLDIKYRARQLNLRKVQIKQWQEAEYQYLQDEVASVKANASEDFDEKAYMADRVESIQREAHRQEKDALNLWGNDFWRQDARIAPLRGALATWGLTVDDINVASFHGTSTKANDKNESDAISKQLTHLGRKKGNAVLGVFQKYLTGHPKGAAGAWMLNGALQILNTGIVPGNRNADNVDRYLERFDKILYPNRTIQTDGVKAVSVTSFGFGQVGGQVIAIHPDYVLATLEDDVLEAYRIKVAGRYKQSYRHLHSAMANNNLIIAKTAPPYTPEQETSVYLDPTARVTYDKKVGSYTFPAKFSQVPDKNKTEATRNIVEKLASATAGTGANIGVDVELISSVNIDNENFVERNFTAAEQEYCSKAPSPQSSYAGSWSAKEAVFKCLGVKSQGGGASLLDIEILRDEKGAPTVKLHGEAEKAASAAGVKNVKVSISHDDFQSVAVAVSEK